MSHCTVKFRGAHIQHDYLKAGIAVFPAESDGSYARHYVPKPVIPEGGYPGAVDDRGIPLDEGDFRAWLESLPTRMELNPVFAHFIRINPDTTLPQLESEIERILTPDVLTSADAFLSDQAKDTERQSFGRFRKLMQPAERLGNGLVLPRGYDAALVAEANEKFKNLGGELDGRGKILDIEPGTIDIGAPAIDRGTNASYNYTRIDLTNPANGAGTLTAFELWFAVEGNDGTDVKVGTFYGTAPDFTNRDYEALGTITKGSKQTASGLSITVASGDYAGIHFTDGRLEGDTSGEGSGGYYKSGDQFGAGQQTYTSSIYVALSLFGEGEESVTEKESSDAGSGVDSVESLETPQAKSSSDAGSGTEGTPISSATLSGSENGSGLEAIIARLLTDGESGGAVEASDVEDKGIFKDLSVSEQGEGADRLVAKIEMPTKGGGMKLWI